MLPISSSREGGGLLDGDVGFALPGALALDAGTALDLLERVVDAGFAPVMFTEVCGLAAPTMAAAVAARRPGVPLGTSIVPLGSRSEAALAMEAATAAQISGAPFLLGVGTSSRQILRDWHDRAHEPSLAVTHERLRTLRAVLDGERRGSFRLPVPAGDRVRVLLAALGPRMAALALDAADGVILNHTPPSAVRDTVPDTDAMKLAFCWVDACEDGERRVRRELVSYVMAAPYARHYVRMGFGEVVAQVHALHSDGRLREAPGMLPQAMVDAFYVTPEALPDRLRAYRRTGVTPVVLPVTGDLPADQIAAFVEGRSWAG
jgi:alkanesulfonate monooxygenase SsuD/methylene tetrahydromethanopterin reductase-like flavin-dependent oxidoreductase (luciferase family)